MIIDFFLFNQTTPNSTHLWYMLALIYVLALARILNDKISIRGEAWIMGFLFFLLLSLSSYSGIFFGYVLPDKYTMNFLFTGLPFFLLGQLLSFQYKKNKLFLNLSLLFKLCLVNLFLMIVEWKIISNINPPAPQNVYFFTIVTATTVFLYFLSSKGNSVLGFIGKNCSSTIYIVHMIVYLSFSILASKLGLSYIFSILAPFLVFRVSLIYSIVSKKIITFCK